MGTDNDGFYGRLGVGVLPGTVVARHLFSASWIPCFSVERRQSETDLRLPGTSWKRLFTALIFDDSEGSEVLTLTGRASTGPTAAAMWTSSSWDLHVKRKL